MHESFSKRDALLIIDAQNDFISGSLAVPRGEQVAHDIVDFIKDGFGGWEPDYVLTTQDWHINPGDHWSDEPDFVDSWPVHCKAGTWGADLHPAIQEVGIHERFCKGKFTAAYSGFEGITERDINVTHRLDKWLQQRDVDFVHIVGIATDYCVKATALDALKYGFDVRVISELCAAVTPEGGERAIDEMRSKGVLIA